MNSPSTHNTNFINRFASVAVLLAMLLQPAFHVIDFAFNSQDDGISMELLEDMDEKELEEEGEFEKIELRNISSDINDYYSSKGLLFNNKTSLIWTFTPENDIPPPEYL